MGNRLLELDDTSEKGGGIKIKLRQLVEEEKWTREKMKNL